LDQTVLVDERTVSIEDIGRIRRAVMHALDEEPIRSDAVDAAAIVVTELLTNALRYGAPPVRIEVWNRAEHVHIAVTDASSTRPSVRRPAGVGGGYGLRLVSRMSAAWGCTPAGKGKTVWADVGNTAHDSLADLEERP
jgi:two-component sensor histidine kinase